MQQRRTLGDPRAQRLFVMSVTTIAPLRPAALAFLVLGCSSSFDAAASGTPRDAGADHVVSLPLPDAARPSPRDARSREPDVARRSSDAGSHGGDAERPKDAAVPPPHDARAEARSDAQPPHCDPAACTCIPGWFPCCTPEGECGCRMTGLSSCPKPP